jgi:hypothetical protein
MGNQVLTQISQDRMGKYREDNLVVSLSGMGNSVGLKIL